MNKEINVGLYSSSPHPVLPDVRSLLGECPVWDDRNQCIYWVDILNGNIHCLSMPHQTYSVISIGRKTGSFVLKEKGGLLAAMKDCVAEINQSGELIQVATQLPANVPNNRFNDGKCDPAGRFWVGTMDEVRNQRGAGSLYVISKGAELRVMIDEVSCSNGLCWSSDELTMYFIDTPTKQVFAFDYDKESGDICNKRTVIEIPEGEGVPDGMTIDEDGMLWIAHWNGWRISRWDPRSGTKLHEIYFPVSRVSSCTFGGETLEDIFVTSAAVGLSQSELESQPLAGSLFVVKNSGFKGMVPFRFKD